MLRSLDEATAFAEFLLTERRRHQDDFRQINRTLARIEKKFGVKIDIEENTVAGVKVTETWIEV